MNPTELPLRDIHLPEAVSWWPMAPGWWILLFLIVIAGIATVAIYRRRSARLKRRVLRELNELQAEWQNNQDHALFLRKLSALVRRSAIAFVGRQSSAGLSGAGWQHFLNEGLDGQPFSTRPGELLVDAIYRPGVPALTEAEVQQLTRLAKHRIQLLQRAQPGAES